MLECMQKSPPYLRYCVYHQCSLGGRLRSLLVERDDVAYRNQRSRSVRWRGYPRMPHHLPAIANAQCFLDELCRLLTA